MLMSDVAHETTQTQFVEVGDVQSAYRCFGQRSGTPLLLLNYFAANLDNWDPKVANGFATERDVILVDCAGIGGSPRETPSTVAPLTKACVEFCRALNLTQFDNLGLIARWHDHAATRGSWSGPAIGTCGKARAA